MQGADPGDQQHDVVLAAELEARVDHVVADALVAEVDFETVSEEAEEVDASDPSKVPILWLTVSY